MSKRKKTTSRKKHVATRQVAKEPEFMVQVPDSKMVRKDILETLREIILFMQGYEAFRKIQQEKVAKFTLLNSDLKQLQIVMGKLGKYLPRGKIPEKPNLFKEEAVEPATDGPEEEHFEKEKLGEKKLEAKKIVKPHQLDELEAQLKEIEGQLRGV